MIAGQLCLATCLALEMFASAHEHQVDDQRANAEAKWSRSKPASYEFTIEVKCFCILARTPPSFRVQNGVAVALTKLSDSERRTYSNFDTVEKLFERLRRVEATKPARIIVAYDPELGYPKSADIDETTDWSDDELLFYVTSFKIGQQ